MNHWLILPILLPAMVAPLLALAVRHDLTLARTFSLGSTVLLVLLGMYQLGMTADGVTRTYSLGDWPAPFGIVLVLDRLAAIMLLLTAVLGLFVLLYAINGCDREGEHFHPLFQFQLMGLNGAFLTGDLFNLFVFFEVLLIASYGLMVHGGGAARIRAGIQYVVINLIGSSIFLVALGLIYGVTGTLNMADFALQLPAVAAGDSALLHCGLALLLVVFGIKSAAVPLHFWLPGTYTNTSGPVAALFSIMTKVGAYAILRIFTLAYGDLAGPVGWFAAPWLMGSAMLTVAVGAVGAIAARSLGQQASFAALGSMGLLLIAVAAFTPQAESSALYYLVHSTLAVAALFLLIDSVIIRRAGFGDALLAAPSIPHAGLIGSLFFIAAIAVVGMPPLSGFIAKLMILQATAALPAWPWIWGLTLLSSLMLLTAFASSGSLLFWKGEQVAGDLEVRRVPPIALPMIAVGSLLALLVSLTLFAGPVNHFFDATADQMFDPRQYIDAVLGETPGGQPS
jgi:multicomponent K+:H+ antiporter subunit D